MSVRRGRRSARGTCRSYHTRRSMTLAWSRSHGCGRRRAPPTGSCLSARADASDLAAFVEALAAKLEQALPWYTRVHRRSTSLLAKRKRVDRIEVTVGEEQYVLNSDRGSIDARRATTVRGIVLKSEPVALDQWIDALARAIAAWLPPIGAGTLGHSSACSAHDGPT